MSKRFLDKEEIRAFYDRFGPKQDWQRIYEGAAMRELLLHGRFGLAESIFELGCGTGAFAQVLLQRYLPETASYVGVDISSTMAGLARERLARFTDRAMVLLTDGSLRFDFRDASFDRFISNYVLDLMSPDDIVKVLAEAHRLLRADGLICLASLTHGRTIVSRAVTRVWNCVHNLNPMLVGGCRPLELAEFLDRGRWNIIFHDVVSIMGIASEIVIAGKTAEKPSAHGNQARSVHGSC
jgi:ubiquinone/menaquinone biosynthesis C-methylase UbiE